MKILLILAWRNLWRNRKRTLITVSSVLFAVLLATLFVSMEKGSYERLIDSMVRYSTGYIQIQDVLFDEEPSIDHTLLFDEEIEAILKKNDEQIAFHVPRLQNFVLVATENNTRGSILNGIDPELEIRMNDLNEDLVKGEFLKPDDNGLMLAEGLAGILNVTVGDTLVLLGQGFHGSTAAGTYPVKGIVDLKIPEINNNTIYMSLSEAQWFYGTGNRVTSLIIMPENPARTQQLAENLRMMIDPEWHRVLTWEELLEDLLNLMKFDVAGTMIMMMILYIIIAFGLFGTILTMLIERRKEFALLFSLGMKRAQVAIVCFFEALFISMAGVVLGIIISIPVVAWFYHHPIPLSGDMAEAIADYGFEPVLPFSADPNIFLNQALIVLIISFLIGLFPVYKVFRIHIMEAKK
ncbi:ABC transporter permease [Natronoflexus pectinivorans]|uniref:ABC-type lipoprotein release transport system permease subunit n=1 Tax=Natronoflexus pectinivorans TaxID=682526 RepID=A0A4R2GM96_9BACT|nr:FtsX-like permease family protein [Natronoflexus pectinivorans]TCO09857.1 ABC-type lipoprotein release transport system permease subunit [Natronoflexus pectinivorans]